MPVAVMQQQGSSAAGSPGRASASPALRAEMFDTFDTARAAWQEIAAAGCATPYQGPDWIEAYFRHVELPQGKRLAIILLRDRQGAPMLLLPLAIEQRGPVRIAAFIGGKHANFNMPVFIPGRGLEAGDLAEALQQAGGLADIDLFALSAQPHDWEGVANPMALLGGQPSPSAGYKLTLAPDGEALLTTRLSKDTRKKLRQKEAKLAKIGPVSYFRPQTAEQARMILAEFLRFKSERFGAQGIDDPFANESVRRFLDEAVTSGLAGSRPSVQLHALKLGERIVSVYGAVCDDRRFCGLFTAFDSDPEVSRGTPGDLLLMAMIKQACADGLTTFDIGVGEARYKAQVCDQKEILFDSFVSVTMKGRVLAFVLSNALAAKGWAKASPTVIAAVARWRKFRAKSA